MQEPDPRDDGTPSPIPEPERKEPGEPLPIEEPGEPGRPEKDGPD
ncbi:hypothetical protein [Stutzerimonas stutzeri]|jgi:hypothetical protein|nr:hypothetical protein [Stutzerimonas stutzeri]EQM76678.1 hypothetical protein L686_16620 [Stutzerimonas stutzeri MF28]